jgi:hypothetical protein
MPTNPQVFVRSEGVTADPGVDFTHPELDDILSPPSATLSEYTGKLRFSR